MTIKERLADIFWDPKSNLETLEELILEKVDQLLEDEPYATKTAEEWRKAAYVLTRVFEDELEG